MPAGDINMYLKDFVMPQVGSGSPIEQFINDRYRLAHGVFDPVTISLTFKDYNSFELYRGFVKYTYESKLVYPDKYLIDLKILKLRDNIGSGIPDSFTVMTFKKCIIKTVSTVTLSNENEAQVAEFTIEIKTSKEPEIGFGEFEHAASSTEANNKNSPSEHGVYGIDPTTKQLLIR